MNFTLRLEKDLAAMLNARAKEEMSSKSRIVKMALFTYLSNNPPLVKPKLKPKKKVLPHMVELSFEGFWKIYPKKRGKGEALKSWKKINPSDQLNCEIIKSIERHLRSPDWLKDGGRFIPNPSTWLNQKRWLDTPGSLLEAAMREGAYKHQKDKSKVELAKEMLRNKDGKDSRPFG